MSSPPRQLHIRDAHPDERAAIEQLTLEAYAEYATVMAPSAWAGLREALHTALDAAFSGALAVERIVAVDADQLLGSVLLYPASADVYGGETDPVGWPELRLLAVVPAARGTGVGRALVDECVRRARRAGATALGLHSSASMQTAVRLYERIGFVRDPAHDFHPDGAELVQAYRLSLDAPALPADH